MSNGPCDQTVGSDRPFFKSGNTDCRAATTGARVPAGQGPAIDGVVPGPTDLVHRHNHVRECSHEALRGCRDRGAADGGGTVIDLQRALFGKERGDAGRVLAAPRGGVPCGELFQTVRVHWSLLRVLAYAGRGATPDAMRGEGRCSPPAGIRRLRRS